MKTEILVTGYGGVSGGRVWKRGVNGLVWFVWEETGFIEPMLSDRSPVTLSHILVQINHMYTQKESEPAYKSCKRFQPW